MSEEDQTQEQRPTDAQQQAQDAQTPRTGTPRATQTRRARRPLPGTARLAVAAVVGGALVWSASALGTTWGAGPGGGTDTAAATTAPPADSFVRSAVLTCPGWPADGDAAAPAVTQALRAATVPTELGAPEEVGDGATLSAPEENREVRFPAGGTPDGLDVDGWALAAAGADAAPGLVASQLVASDEQGARGVSLTPCRAPAEVVHLVGGGPGAGRVEQVVVTNPGSDPVRVALEVSGVDGPAEVSGGRGLVVPARGRTAYLLDALAPGVESPVVTVVAEGGEVTAHLVEQEREGSVDLGLEVVPAAAEPARDLVLPALPGPGELEGERSVTVRIFAPEDEAVVELRALTAEGAVVPTEPAARVPAGASVDIELGELADEVVGLRLRSDQPVTAAAQLRVAPASDEPVVVEDDAATTEAPGDDARSTASPDGASATGRPDEAGSTATPDDAASTRGPDPSTSTAGPDDASTTTGPDDAPAGPRVVRPAGETAWITAVALTGAPVGTAVPSLEAVPGGDGEAGGAGEAGESRDGSGATVSLAVSSVDATTAEVLWLAEDGSVTTEDVRLANDTTQVVEVPSGTAAVWVRPTGAAGVVAALHVTATDSVGPYVAATTLPTVPWTRALTEVRPVLP